MKKIAAIILTAILVVTVIVLITRKDSDQSTQIDNSTDAALLQSPSQSAESQTTVPIIGSPTAPVQIIEFIDYKCPTCNRFHRGVGQELKETYVDTNQAYFEIRHIPFIGPDSERAALGAYCAAEQNVFETYNDAVFDHLWDNYYQSGNLAPEFQDILTIELLRNLMVDTDVDSDIFVDCIESKKYAQQLEADATLASRSGVSGTPSFIIGGRTLVNQQPFSVFESFINLELRQ